MNLTRMSAHELTQDSTIERVRVSFKLPTMAAARNLIATELRRRTKETGHG